jgi:hypothetical protein
VITTRAPDNFPREYFDARYKPSLYPADGSNKLVPYGVGVRRDRHRSCSMTTKDRETSTMQLELAVNRRALQLVWLLPVLIALGACADTSSRASAIAPSQMRVAGGNRPQNGTQSVSAVSDALGQRLDAMVNNGQIGGRGSR